MEKTAIELFAGVGGFRVGLNKINDFDPMTGRAIENGDWDFVWANQWEPSTKVQHAYDAYTTRFGKEHTSNEDINSINKNEIPNHTILFGGFPCQDYSVARTKSNEKGLEGKKGVLFWDIVEILEAKSTPFFLLENVDRLLKSPAIQRGKDFGIMLRSLSDLGYNLEWRVINAADYGRAQRRRRVFIFGWKKSLNYNQLAANTTAINFLSNESLFAKTFPIEEYSKNHLESLDITLMKDTVEMTEKFAYNFENTGYMIDGLVYTFKSIPIKEDPITLGNILDLKSNNENLYLTKEQEEKFKYLKGGKRVPRVKPNGEKYFYSEGAMSPTDNLNLPGRTMLTSESSVNRSSHIIIDPISGNKRFISPVEAERLQDFPDNWTDTGMPFKRRYFMMGNALVTGIINRLEQNISYIVENED